jgi:predicted secreted protein
MALVSGIVVFFVIWWTALFTVLPFSITRDKTGKPNDPKLKAKFLMTTFVTAIIWLIIYVVIEADLISFRDIANIMAADDLERIKE